MSEGDGILIIICGLPGVGKSFLATKLKDRFGDDEVVVLNGDAITKELFSEPSYSVYELKRVHEEMRARAFDLLIRGMHVIYDATNIRREYRETLRELARRAKVPHIVVKVVADEETVIERLRHRKEDPMSDSEADYDVYLRMKERLELPVGPCVSVRSDQRFDKDLNLLIGIINLASLGGVAPANEISQND